MSNLQYRQQKIQEKRKKTSFRDFVMEITSRYSLMLYKQQGLISMCDANSRLLIVNKNEYVPELSDLLPEGEYFFDKLATLLQTVGLPNLIHFSENANSDYANCVLGSKNIYLSYTVIKEVENAMYSFSVKTGSRNVIDGFMIRDNSENIYRSKCVISSYNTFYSKFINNSSDVRFSSNLQSCRECLFCDGLTNQSFCIRNKQYSKEEYTIEKQLILSQKGNYDLRYEQVNNQGNNTNSLNSSGNYIVNSDNVESGMMVYEIENARNIILIGGKDKGFNVYDCFLNTPPIDSIYGGLSLGTGCEHIYNAMHITRSSNIYYSIFLEDCSFCIGCIGLKNKQYCILNKQYTKEDRYNEIDKIFGFMETDGTLGNFFPSSLCPFYFNDTAAYLIGNGSFGSSAQAFTKEEMTAKGYLRRDEPIRADIPAGAETVKTTELSQFESLNDGIRALDPGILKKVIVDENGNSYRIIKLEYDFLVKYGLPLPRKHWLDRMKENFRIN